jgi:hypothetical protein
MSQADDEADGALQKSYKYFKDGVMLQFRG